MQKTRKDGFPCFSYTFWIVVDKMHTQQEKTLWRAFPRKTTINI